MSQQVTMQRQTRTERTPETAPGNPPVSTCVCSSPSSRESPKSPSLHTKPRRSLRAAFSSTFSGLRSPCTYVFGAAGAG